MTATRTGDCAMNHLDLVRTYLKEKVPMSGIPRTGFPFVAISQQTGTDGHLLAHVILTDFLKYPGVEMFQGWQVFDRQICEVIAEDPLLHSSMDDLLAERFDSEGKQLMDGLMTGRPDQYLQYRRMFQVMRMLATLGKVILVGRAGPMVTHGMPGGVHIRLMAQENTRIRWVEHKMKIDREAARTLVHQQDADRRRLVQTFFDKDIDDPLVYDAVWNTDQAGLHEISQSVIQMLLLRAEKPLPR